MMKPNHSLHCCRDDHTGLTVETLGPAVADHQVTGQQALIINFESMMRYFESVMRDHGGKWGWCHMS